MHRRYFSKDIFCIFFLFLNNLFCYFGVLTIFTYVKKKKGKNTKKNTKSIVSLKYCTEYFIHSLSHLV